MEKAEFDSYVKAGRIAHEVKEFARGYIKRGMKLIDIACAIDDKILELGGEAAFPVGLGVDEVAAHFTPTIGDESVAKGLICVDIGVSVDGFIGDTAFSLDLSEDSRYGDIIEFNEKVLGVASEVVRVGMAVKDIGCAVQDFVEEKKDERFAVVKSLCGHSLAKDTIHTSPTVSNYRNDNGHVFENDAFAIEPFVTSGVGDIFEGGPGGIYALKSEGRVRDRDARKVLEFVGENYKTRPFCARWLIRGIRNSKLDIKETKLRFVLGMLVRQGIFYEYPILIEKSRQPVSQVENTFLVANEKVVCTTG